MPQIEHPVALCIIRCCSIALGLIPLHDLYRIANFLVVLFLQEFLQPSKIDETIQSV